MHMLVTPSYRDIFKDEPPSIDSLLFDIPSKAIIAFLSAINADLFFETNKLETQGKIYRFWSRGFSDKQKDIIFNGIKPFLKKDSDIFAFWYTMEFIQRELINYRDFEIEDTTPDQEFRLLKAYFLIVEKCNDSHKNIFRERPKNNPRGEFHFQEVTWPLLAGQFDFNKKVDPIYEVAKTYVLLQYLFEQPDTTKYIQNFLAIVKRKNVLHYVFDLLVFIKSIQSHDETKPFKTFSFIAEPEFNVIFDGWCIDRIELQNNLDKQKDYLGLREKPLFKLPDGKYIAMNWSFLNNQLNLGLLFAFNKISGIKELYPTFLDFKRDISKKVSEEIIFSGIIKKALHKKYTVTNFSNAYNDDFPDCYHREGKNVFLFEFKDGLMPIKAISSGNYETIKADIDTKFIESGEKKKGKGIRQVLQQIKKLNESKLGGDDFEAKGIKKRNLVIYPIIVYTHFMYTMPGINTYLNSIFKKELDAYDKTTQIQFATVKDIVMIDFEFFFKNFLLLKNEKYFLKKLLDNYIDKMKKLKEKALKEQTVENILKANSGFEEVPYHSDPGFDNKNYVKELFEALGIVVESPEP